MTAPKLARLVSRRYASIKVAPSVRRSMLYVPASSPKMIKGALEKPISSSSADALCFDLEDSVALNKKSEARRNALDALTVAERGKREYLVRVNSRTTGLTEEDLSIVLTSDKVDGIVLPKIQTAEDVRWADDLVSKLASSEVKDRIRLIASVESALAIMNLKEIAQSSSRLDALLFAAEDYTADVGIQRSASRTEMLYARSAVVNAARAYNLGAMDLVTINLDDASVLQEECAEGRRLGFTSKQAIHPKQVEAINAAFSPSEAAIKRAVAILEQNATHSQAGKGAFSFAEEGSAGSTMIDAPMILQATTLAKRANALNMTVPWTKEPLPGF